METAHLIAAGQFLAERGSFGMVWFDSKLIVRRAFGPLVDFVIIDRPLTESVIALVGFEEDISELPQSGSSLTIPNVLLSGGAEAEAGDLPRLSLDIFWDERAQSYLMLVRHVVDHSAIEAELRTQMRLRAIAEAELVEKSAAIQRANQELAQVNRDLEEFAYVISHDLKAPLRALRYDGQDASQALADGDLETVGARLSTMQRQQVRMLAMLNGLFDYARAGNKADALEEVDTRCLVDDIVASLERMGAAIRVEGDWPKLMTLAPPLELVVRNLLQNAIKHHDRPDGRILISAEEDEHALNISVQDDGPGIPAEWHSAVFLPFRKVHDMSGTEENSGMGLALVRRTLDRVGGNIQLHSEAPLKRGTTFRVQWPKAIRA